MADKNLTLQRNREKQREKAHNKAMEAIQELEAAGKAINFSSVGKQSGVSRSYLYDDESVRRIIEEYRTVSVQNEMNRRAKYDKTSHSKDVIIKAKDKRIARLEEENRKLKAELMNLRGLLYESR
ncbi:MAG: transposase [Lachnospiraceae bacterium]|nr:transposase [Lachnospiraceae bacterium]